MAQGCLTFVKPDLSFLHSIRVETESFVTNYTSQICQVYQTIFCLFEFSKMDIVNLGLVLGT